MSKAAVGFVGWRGMVGSVLQMRMVEEHDFDNIDAVFFSTSQAGQPAPAQSSRKLLEDAYDLQSLLSMDAIISCQGSEYTKKVHHELRSSGWSGYWIDAASTLRTSEKSVLVLDPVNGGMIERKLSEGAKDLIGANCTVSTMLMGLTGLFNSGQIEWVSSMTYQAASGAGAKHMKELIKQMISIGHTVVTDLENPGKSILEIDSFVSNHLKSSDFPTENLGFPLAANILPWIDSPWDNGQTREEWKGMVETNKILGTENLPIDGTCVRVGSMRSHAHGLTIKLKSDIPIAEIEKLITTAHEWVKLVPNTQYETLSELTPAAVSGSLKIHVGRLRKMNLGPKYLNVFTVGDQLLWGAAEPLRRALKIALNY